MRIVAALIALVLAGYFVRRRWLMRQHAKRVTTLVQSASHDATSGTIVEQHAASFMVPDPVAKPVTAPVGRGGLAGHWDQIKPPCDGATADRIR
jgi:hypothetical protein